MFIFIFQSVNMIYEAEEPLSLVLYLLILTGGLPPVTGVCVIQDHYAPLLLLLSILKRKDHCTLSFGRAVASLVPRQKVRGCQKSSVRMETSASAGYLVAAQNQREEGE